MRDTTPGGVRAIANRNEIRAREADRSARRTGDLAAAAARGCITYAERTTGNVTLPADTERVVIPGVVVPVEPGRQYRVKARGMLWVDGTTPGYGNLQVRYLLSTEGAAAGLADTALDVARIYAPPGGYGIVGDCERTVPPFSADQYTFLSVQLSAVIGQSRTGGVHGAPAHVAARLWVFDDGAAAAAVSEDVAETT